MRNLAAEKRAPLAVGGAEGLPANQGPIGPRDEGVPYLDEPGLRHCRNVFRCNPLF